MFNSVSLRGLFCKPWQSIFILLVFFASIIGPLPQAQADEFRLPAPGVMVHLSLPLDPPILKGIKVHPNNPFRFDFILDQGDRQPGDMASAVSPSRLSSNEPTPNELKQEATKLIKYFLASLTMPENDLWVNLSPYEKNRIIPQSFGLTEMGRDLLAEDYMLKQITASLIYPEDEIGKKFWKRIYEEAYKKFGTTNVPVNTFNKVWIVPDKAVVYENPKAGTAYVVESRLKVMLEQDYLALSKNVSLRGASETSDEAISKRTINSVEIATLPTVARNDTRDVNALASQIIRQIVIPELTKEVNDDKNFAQLRQVYNSLILATWYKKKIKDSIFEQVYADKKKIAGVEYKNSVILPISTQARQPGDMALAVSPSHRGKQPNDVELIYYRYLQAFKKGVYNYIKEEPDPETQETIPRKYFSGGVDFDQFGSQMNPAMIVSQDLAMVNRRVFLKMAGLYVLTTSILPISKVVKAQAPLKAVGNQGKPLLEPPNNKILTIIGQDKKSIDEYIKEGERIPAGFMTYTSIKDLEGLWYASDRGAGLQNAQALIDRYPNTVLQIGLNLQGALGADFKTTYGPQIKKLADWFKKNKKTPFFLRIGYEFDYEGNKYDPQDYKDAYMFIVDELRRQGVVNVAFVWHSVAWKNESFKDYYPGKGYVDWIGLTYFNNTNEIIGEKLILFAKEENKPVMIAEASPWEEQTPQAKAAWFKGFFGFISKHSNIKAISYINGWVGKEFPDKADTKVIAPGIKDIWDSHVKGGAYLHSSGDLYRLINFNSLGNSAQLAVAQPKPGDRAMAWGQKPEFKEYDDLIQFWKDRRWVLKKGWWVAFDMDKARRIKEVDERIRILNVLNGLILKKNYGHVAHFFGTWRTAQVITKEEGFIYIPQDISQQAVDDLLTELRESFKASTEQRQSVTFAVIKSSDLMKETKEIGALDPTDRIFTMELVFEDLLDEAKGSKARARRNEYGNKTIFYNPKDRTIFNWFQLFISAANHSLQVDVKKSPAMLTRADSAPRADHVNGGIDLTPAHMNVQTRVGDSRFLPAGRQGRGNDIGDGGIKFHIDPAMLQQLQEATGFVPVIIDMHRMIDLKQFLESSISS